MKPATFSFNFDYEIYCQSESLLLQFIIEEYIELYPHLTALKGVLKAWNLCLKTREFSQLKHAAFKQIQYDIQHLAGPLLPPPTPLPWKNRLGSLQKIEQYSYLLSARTKGESQKTYLALYEAANESHTSAIGAKEQLLHSEEHGEQDLNLIFYTNLFSLIGKFIQKDNPLEEALISAVVAAGQDENIFLQLLYHRSKVSSSLQLNFIDKINQKLYPEGAEQAKSFARSRYAWRGFSNIAKCLT